MKAYRFSHWVVAALIFSFTTTARAVEFDSGFSPGMIIQRGAVVRISGTSGPDAEVTVNLDETRKAVRAAKDGRWSAEFPAMVAGGPHSIRATDPESSVVLDDVLVGDLWLCSGQSNMQMGIREAVGGKETLAAISNSNLLRVLTIPRGGAKVPQEKFNATWQRVTEEQSSDFSAVALFFAEHLMTAPAMAGVPVGLINSSFGGTAIEAWTPEAALPALPDDQLSGSMFGIPIGALFNGMIAPLTARPIKGVIWYQGEANAGHPTVYRGLLKNLVVQWRQAWQQPDLPFLVVQLPAFTGRMGGYDFSGLREAQAAACAETEGCELAVTFDTNRGDDLHPVEKQEIGRRLALLARRSVYQEPVISAGPEFQRADRDGNQMRLIFQSEDGMRTRDGAPVQGFEVAAADGEYRYAMGTLTGTTVVVGNAAVTEPVTVRYAWGALPTGNLTNASGLPVVPFRTDDLAPEKVAFQSLPVTRKLVAPRYELVTNENGMIGSLIVGGKQFLSNEANGGTRIPDGWGQRNFKNTEPLGPRQIRLSDNSGSLQIDGQDDSMQWTLQNDREREIEFRISLLPSVRVDFAEGTARLARGDLDLKIEGLDHSSGGPEPELVAKIPAHGKVTLKVSVPAR